jgi:hypothetical protein
MKPKKLQRIISLIKMHQFNVSLGSFGMDVKKCISFVPASNYEDLAKAILTALTKEEV